MGIIKFETSQKIFIVQNYGTMELQFIMGKNYGTIGNKYGTISKNMELWIYEVKKTRQINKN